MTRDLAERRGVETTVYGAAADSQLLVDAAVETVEAVEKPLMALDCGTGSGYVGGKLAEVDARVIASDLNPHACAQAHNRGLETVRGNLLEPFHAGVFDLVVFNPPYLPTNPENEWDDWMEVALSGGESGRAVIEPFLDSVGRVLAPDGVVLLLVSSLTGFETVVEYAEKQGFESEVIAEELFPFETLSVLEIAR